MKNRFIRDRCMVIAPNCNPSTNIMDDMAKGLSWKAGCRHGKLQQNHCKLCGDGPTLWTQTVLLPTSLTNIIVSIIRGSICTYIAGFEIIYNDGTPNTILGYRVPGSQVTMDIEIGRLRGFIVATEYYEINAIRPVSTADSNWIGEPIPGSPSVQLVSTQDIKALSGVFYVSVFNCPLYFHTLLKNLFSIQDSRMVSLAIGTASQSANLPKRMESEHTAI